MQQNLLPKYYALREHTACAMAPRETQQSQGLLLERLNQLERRVAMLEGADGEQDEVATVTNDAFSPIGIAMQPLAERTEGKEGLEFGGEAELSEAAVPNKEGQQACYDLSEADDYELADSVWESIILVGVPGVTPMGGSVYSIFLLLLNIVVQSVFTVIVLQTQTTPIFTDDTVLAFRDWRRNIAHQFSNMDTNTEISLAARVCAGDASLAVSTGQAATQSILSTYMSPNHVLGVASGPLMCCLAMFCWLLIVVRLCVCAYMCV